MEDIKLISGDSLQALKGYADNHFDWAIVDPPYGIDIAKWDAIDMKLKKQTPVYFYHGDYDLLFPMSYFK